MLKLGSLGGLGGQGGQGGFQEKANCPPSEGPELNPLLDLAASGW